MELRLKNFFKVIKYLKIVKQAYELKNIWVKNELESSLKSHYLQNKINGIYNFLK